MLDDLQPVQPVPIPYHVHNGADAPFINAKDIRGLVLARVATQYDRANNTTLGNITNLSVGVSAQSVYGFEAVLFVTADATGGHKYAINGTCTAASLIANVISINDATNGIRISSRLTTLGGSVGEALGTEYFTTIQGTIKTTKGGILSVQFAQNVGNGTSSVLVGSYFKVQQLTII